MKSGAWISPAVHVILAALIIAVAFVIARVAVYALRRLRQRHKTGRPIIYLIEKLAAYGIVVAGLFLGVATVGIDLNSLAVVLGGVAIGASLGLQNVVRDFVAGMLIVFDPFIQVGDFVELESGVQGEIIEIGPRATRLLTNDGVNVIIANSRLTDGQVVNWTMRGGGRRIHVPFAVAYGADKEKVRAVILKAAHDLPFTRPDSDTEKTQVWLVGFGDSSLNFELVVWPSYDAVRRPSAMHAAYTWAIEDALRRAGIEIPFPQMDLRVRNLFGREGTAALDALGLEAREHAPKVHVAGESHNDAADAVVADAAKDARARAEREQSEPERTGRDAT